MASDGEQGRGRLDPGELGRAAQLLYDAFSLIEGVGGSLSPYVPTQEFVADAVAWLAAGFAWARRGPQGQPVYYEPGCGAGRVAERASGRGMYALCLELDEYLAREAAARARRSVSMDVVVGDLSVFRPRRVSVAYAYLLPRAVSRVLGALQGLGAAVLSLDYPSEDGFEEAERVSIMDVRGRNLYVYAV